MEGRSALIGTSWLVARAHHLPLHGQAHIAKQRLIALLLIITGMMRVVAWVSLIALYFAGAAFAHKLFQDVWFVAIISLYANAATDFGQVCASLAQLSASDAHHDSEATRAALGVDVTQLDEDIARLAALQPGDEAQQLANEIRHRIGRNP